MMKKTDNLQYIYKDKSGKKRKYYIIYCSKCNKKMEIRDDTLSKNTGVCMSCQLKQRKIGTKHGKSNTRLYSIWRSMKSRCNSKNNTNYSNYGGRGIKVCDEWLQDFMNFYNWAISSGYKDNLTIDRIDVNGNYEPSNCRWATIKEQNNNTRRNHYVDYKGEKVTISELSKLLNINKNTLWHRINAKKKEEK